MTNTSSPFTEPSYAEKALLWARVHWERVSAAGITLAGGVGLLVYFFAHTKALEEQAWTEILNAQALASQGQVDQSLERLTQVIQRYARLTASLHAKLLKGEILAKQGKWKESEAVYQQLSIQKENPELRPLALLGLASCQSRQQRLGDAITTYQRFLTDFPDHFLTPKIYANLAQSQSLAGLPDQAKQTRTKLQALYPNTPWAAANRPPTEPSR